MHSTGARSYSVQFLGIDWTAEENKSNQRIQKDQVKKERRRQRRSSMAAAKKESAELHAFLLFSIHNKDVTTTMECDHVVKEACSLGIIKTDQARHEQVQGLLVAFPAWNRNETLRFLMKLWMKDAVRSGIYVHRNEAPRDEPQAVHVPPTNIDTDLPATVEFPQGDNENTPTSSSSEDSPQWTLIQALSSSSDSETLQSAGSGETGQTLGSLQYSTSDTDSSLVYPTSEYHDPKHIYAFVTAVQNAGLVNKYMPVFLNDLEADSAAYTEWVRKAKTIHMPKLLQDLSASSTGRTTSGMEALVIFGGFAVNEAEDYQVLFLRTVFRNLSHTRKVLQEIRG